MEPAMRKTLIILLGTLLAAFAVAAPLPYDESADAKAAVQDALGAAKKSQVPVFVIFGANWCEDCRALDLAIKSGRSAELLARQFKVVKVDIGNFDRNLDLVAAYGNPIKKGIPAAVILSPSNEVLYATRAGELADARRMSESGIYDFLRKVTQTAKAKR
jgi:protein disulfide-isomerase